jgi:hypothetical protein
MPPICDSAQSSIAQVSSSNPITSQSSEALAYRFLFRKGAKQFKSRSFNNMSFQRSLSTLIVHTAQQKPKS